MGRLLITFLLCEAGELAHPVLYLSHYFKSHRTEYYDRLQGCRGGEWEAWLAFFLQGVVEISGAAADAARHILELRERHRGLIAADFGRSAGSASMLLEELYATPIVSVNQVGKILNCSYQTANALVTRLEEAGMLQEITGQARNRRFSYQPYIDIFSN